VEKATEINHSPALRARPYNTLLHQLLLLADSTAITKYLIINNQKNKCHHTLKGVVCDRHLFLGCSEMKIATIHYILKDVVFISDIISYHLSDEIKRNQPNKKQ